MPECHTYKVSERQVDGKYRTPLAVQYIFSYNYEIIGEGRILLSSYNGCCFHVGFLCTEK